MKIPHLIVACVVGCLTSIAGDYCLAFQGNEKALDEAKLVESSQGEEVQPEEVPAIFGFDGGLRIMGVSASGNGTQTNVREQNENNSTVRTAVVIVGSEGVSVKVTRLFGAEQREELFEAYPMLTEDVGGFPRDVEGLDIELNIGISKTFAAKDIDEFQKKYPSVFRAYQNQLGRRGRGIFGGRRAAPRIPRVRPDAPDFERLVERAERARPAISERMLEQLGKELEAAKTQVELFGTALEASQKKFGEDHRSVESAKAALNAAEIKVSGLQKKLEMLEKASELQKLDRIKLEKDVPEKKQPEDKQ